MNAQVIRITTGQVIYEGTVKECRKYKRSHYDQFSVIYLDGVVQHG